MESKQNTVMRSTRKYSLIVGAVCFLLCISLLLGMWSTAKYTSRVEGKVELEPALFNTALLGNLPFMKGDGGQLLETDGKLASSIHVTTAMEFGSTATTNGSSTGFNSDDRRLRPGSVVAIPFTVTNGTSLGEADEDGNITIPSNLADTDIAYSIQLTTTVNIPLQYDIYSYTNEAEMTSLLSVGKEKFNYEEYTKVRDAIREDKLDETYLDGDGKAVNWGKLLDMSAPNHTSSELIGACNIYKVQTEDTADEDKFYLNMEKKDGADVISVDRYMLVAYWPDQGATPEETEALRSTEYMKEIDILEVRLEVESWVVNASNIGEENDEPTTSLLRLEAAAAGSDGFYLLPAETGANKNSPNQSNVYGTFTLPFYAARFKELVDNKVTDYLDITITNASKMGYQWNDKTETYESIGAVALENGQVAIAVPVQATMGTVNDYCNTANKDYTYKIEYDGNIYEGTLTGQYVTTETWQEDGVSKLHDKGVKNAYRIVTFSRKVDNVDTPLTLDTFDGKTVSEETVRLLITYPDTDKFKTPNSDNFKVFVYKGSQDAAEE